MLDYDKSAWHLFRQFPLVITLLQFIYRPICITLPLEDCGADFTRLYL